MTILSVLGLRQMKGCDADGSDDSTNAPQSTMGFTVMLGFMFLLLWFCLRRYGQANADVDVENEPDAEPAAISEHTAPSEAAAVEVPPEPMRHHSIQPTVEGYLVWLNERCSRRRDNAATVERRLLYEERVTILYGLKSAVEDLMKTFVPQHTEHLET